jgi:hypothetical protein
MDANSKGTIVNTTKSRPDISQQCRVAIEVPYGQLSLGSTLNVIERVGAFFYNDSIPIANDPFQLHLPALENLLKSA